jgi:hypothetical protein
MKNLLSLFLPLMLSGCVFFRVPYETRKEFTYCYNGNYTGIDSLINIDGYYHFPPKSKDKESLGNVKAYHNCMFFKDGFFVFDVCLECLKSDETIEHTDFYKGGGRWGLYKIDGDVIKTYSLNPLGSMSLDLSEIWFKIIDNKTILYLQSKSEVPNNQEDLIKLDKFSEIYEVYGNFKYFEHLPDPNKTWLKKEKWIWCNEPEYKEWKKH